MREILIRSYLIGAATASITNPIWVVNVSRETVLSTQLAQCTERFIVDPASSQEGIS